MMQNAGSTPQDPNALRASYDAMPYMAYPREATNLHHVTTVAVLAGITPASPHRCRVLEVGSGTGGNLLPMAATMPDSEFLGIDLSPVHIEMANATAREAKVSNVRFETMDLTQFPESRGKFDYILCHGLYSWIPPAVAERLLDLIARHLAPNGVAYVSYNTYPGWHLRGMARDMMLYHTRAVPASEPATRVREARRLLSFLTEFATDLKNNPTNAHAAFLESEAYLLSNQADNYVAHDHLALYNEPAYFWQFAERIDRHGLQYVGECLPPMWHATGVGTVSQRLPEIAKDPVALQQYVDFLMCTFHRQSILVQKGVTVRHEPPPPLDGFFARSISPGTDPGAAAPGDVDLTQGVAQPFPTREGVKIGIKDQMLKAVLQILARGYPQAISWPALLEQARAMTGLPSGFAGPGSRERSNVERTMLHCHHMGMLSLQAYEQPVASRPGPTPLAMSLARLQATTETGVTNLLHQWIAELSPLDRSVLSRCDGTRNAEQLRREASGGNRPKDVTDSAVQSSLDKLARSALLLR